MYELDTLTSQKYGRIMAGLAVPGATALGKELRRLYEIANQHLCALKGNGL